MHELDLIEICLLQAGCLVLIAILTMVARAVLKKLHVELSAAQTAELEAIAGKAMNWAIRDCMLVIKTKGWDVPETKAKVILAATNYAMTQFPVPLRRAGIHIDDENPQVPIDQMAALMERKYPLGSLAAAQVSRMALADMASERLIDNRFPSAALSSE